MNPDTTNSSSLPTPEPAAVGAGQGTPSPQPAAPHGPLPPQAGDGDRIEQAWVTKLKKVLLATRNDPYEQARELAMLRADYMQKRYNKEIKLSE